MLTKLANPAWAILEYGSYPLLLLIVTPWFLHQLGTEHYGHWMLLAAVVNFGGILNSGTGSATIKAISAGLGRSDEKHSGRVVGASLAIAIVGGGILALLIASVFWAGAPVVLNRMGDTATVRLTGTAAAVLIWIEQLDNVYSSAMKGAERFGQAARVEIICKTAQMAVGALVVFAVPTLAALYLSLVVTALVRLRVKATVASRLLGLTAPRPSLRHVSEVLHFAKWGWLQGIGGVLFNVVDRLLVGSLLGAASLAYYAIASQAAMQVHAVSSAGLSVIFPRVSRELERSRHFSLRRLVALTMTANLLLSTALAALVITAGPSFLRLWIGTETAGPASELLPWLVVAYWILALNAVFYFVLLGMGRIRFISLTVLGSGILAAVGAYFAISANGLAGAPTGRVIYALLALALVFPVARALRERSGAAFTLSSVVASSDGRKLL